MNKKNNTKKYKKTKTKNILGLHCTGKAREIGKHKNVPEISFRVLDIRVRLNFEKKN